MLSPVAERELSCLFEGRTEGVVVSLGCPREDDGHFVCEYEISFLGKSETYKIAGLDGIHALQLAVFMIGSTLLALPGTSDWTWNGEPYTGFPTSLDQPIIGLRR